METHTQLSPEYRLLRFMNDFDHDVNLEREKAIKTWMKMAESDFNELFDIFVKKKYIIDQDRNVGCWRITTDGQRRLNELEKIVDLEKHNSASNKIRRSIDFVAYATIIIAIIEAWFIYQQTNYIYQQNDLIRTQDTIMEQQLQLQKKQLLQDSTRNIIHDTIYIHK